MCFTYYIYHHPTNTHYYGARWAKDCAPEDLWSSYYTSSHKVGQLIEQYGEESFTVSVRKVFTSSEECKRWERKVLKRLRVVDKDNWLNQNYGTPPAWKGSRVGQGLGRKLSREHKQSISNGNKGKKRGAAFCKHMSEIAKGRTRRPHSAEVKAKISSSNRASAPQWRFVKDDDTFTGCLVEWAEHYGVNKNSAAATFCAGRDYQGWSREAL